MSLSISSFSNIVCSTAKPVMVQFMRDKYPERTITEDDIRIVNLAQAHFFDSSLQCYSPEGLGGCFPVELDGHSITFLCMNKIFHIHTQSMLGTTFASPDFTIRPYLMQDLNSVLQHLSKELEDDKHVSPNQIEIICAYKEEVIPRNWRELVKNGGGGCKGLL